MPSREPSTRDETFREELERCLPTLRARALKLCLNQVEAQDLVQDTFVRALCFQSTFREGTNLKAWAQQVLFSVFATRCRKLRRERRALETFGADPNAWLTATTTLVPHGLPPRMDRALASLSPNFRAVLSLVDLREMSYREAADLLDVPVGTVMSRLFRARKQLALALGEASPAATEAARMDATRSAPARVDATAAAA